MSSRRHLQRERRNAARHKSAVQRALRSVESRAVRDELLSALGR